MISEAAMALPRYECHKKVWALKIRAIEKCLPTIEELEGILNRAASLPSIGAIITPEEPGYAPFGVSVEYVHKHKPEVGGYYVIYKDGYQSFSPAEAFEEGYTAI
jgi:hypothetical protein